MELEARIDTRMTDFSRDRSRLGTWFSYFRRYPVVPALIILGLAVCAIFAPLLSSYDPLRAESYDAQQTPPFWYADGSTKYILGTDYLGRDVVTRMIHGTRISLYVAFSVLGIGGVIGTAVGLISGYFGGTVDEIIMRFVDLTLAVPFILVALVVGIVLDVSLNTVVILLVMFFWNGFARQVRAETLQLKTTDYVALAKVAGSSPVRIMYKHILPGVFSTVIVIATLTVGVVILVESILSFLGVGVPAPTPTWGAMIADGRNYLATGWWMAFFPGLAILFTVLAFNFLGDWLRDTLDPRLRQIEQ